MEWYETLPLQIAAITEEEIALNDPIPEVAPGGRELGVFSYVLKRLWCIKMRYDAELDMANTLMKGAKNREQRKFAAMGIPELSSRSKILGQVFLESFDKEFGASVRKKHVRICEGYRVVVYDRQPDDAFYILL